MRFMTRMLPAVLLVGALSAQGQYLKLHRASVSAGGFGQFNTILEQNPRSATLNFTTTSPSGITAPATTTVTNQRQDTTWSAGFLTSFQFHPVAWAGVEMNYGYTRYSEEYSYNPAFSLVGNHVRIPVNEHEATGAYLFHPKHIPFQPFMGIGGGAIDFNPAFPQSTHGTNQWRGAGLLEAGFDLPTMTKHIAFRVEGRSLYYRSPNFSTPYLSTRSWRVQTEPVVSAIYRF
jgi:hypothetical protein